MWKVTRESESRVLFFVCSSSSSSINVVFRLMQDGARLSERGACWQVILCCSTVTERKFICRATVCAVVKLPPGPEYTVTWGLLPEESGESLAKTPMGLGAGNMNVSFRLKKAATGPQAKAQSGGDQWWAGLAHHSHGKSSKKSVQVLCACGLCSGCELGCMSALVWHAGMCGVTSVGLVSRHARGVCLC